MAELFAGLLFFAVVGCVVAGMAASVRAIWHAGTAAKRLGRRFPPHAP